ncbi:MAG: DcrB-related protein [Acidobacteria bacterium]|nr:DcrB-related protein [Acidobacteriota bacterium]
MKLQHNEFSTEIPATWEDRTMITLIAPFGPGEFASNIVVTRHPVGPADSLEDFVAAQLDALRQSLPGFELLDTRRTTIDNRPASQQLHRFQSDQGFIQQVQTFVLARQTVYIITGSSTVADFEKHLQAFRDVVENFAIAE